MKVRLDYRPDFPIRNLQALPAGTGCRFLECIPGEEPAPGGGLLLTFVAKQWRRSVPADFKILIDFGPTFQ